MGYARTVRILFLEFKKIQPNLFEVIRILSIKKKFKSDPLSIYYILDMQIEGEEAAMLESLYQKDGRF
jgi:hypothetical protein